MVKKKEYDHRSKLDSALDKIESDIDKYKRSLENPYIPIEEPVPIPDADTVKKVIEETIEKKVDEFRKPPKKPFKNPFKNPFKQPHMPSFNIDMKGLGNIGFYFLTSLLCSGVLAYLFGSMETFVFYTAFGMFVWWWAHQFHATESGTLRSFLSLGSVVVFLYLFYWLFNDLFSLLFCVLYAMSFIIAGVLYFYHFKREMSDRIHRSFPLTFLVMFYSHIIAFTAASVVAYVLPMFLLSGYFVSILYFVFAWVLPVLLVYFFLTKYLYLRFFDSVHIRRDLLKGLVHGVIYAAIFVLVLWMVYLLTAIQLVGMERETYDDTFTDIFTTLQNAKSDIKGSPFIYDSPELLNLQVAQDIISLSESLVVDDSELKSRVDKERFSFRDYASDDYFTVLSRNRFEIMRAQVIAEEIDELKSDLFRQYEQLDKDKSTGFFPDGSKSMDEHYAALADYVASAGSAYTEPFEFARLKSKIYDSTSSYDYLMADGELVDFNLMYDPDMSMVVAGKSKFSIRFYDMLYHTAVFRDLMLMVSETLMFQVEETLNPYSLLALRTPAPDESLHSKVLRYRIIKSDVDATLALAE